MYVPCDHEWTKFILTWLVWESIALLVVKFLWNRPTVHFVCFIGSWALHCRQGCPHSKMPVFNLLRGRPRLWGLGKEWTAIMIKFGVKEPTEIFVCRYSKALSVSATKIWNGVGAPCANSFQRNLKLWTICCRIYRLFPLTSRLSRLLKFSLPLPVSYHFLVCANKNN